MAGQRMKMDEVALYTVKDGKIVHEEFLRHVALCHPERSEGPGWAGARRSSIEPPPTHAGHGYCSGWIQ